MRNKVKGIAVLSCAFLLLTALLSIAALAEQASDSPEQLTAPADRGTLAAASYEKAAENGRLALYVNKATLGIKVEDKTNGYVWNGTLDEKDEKLNQTWQSFFESGLTVEYMDAKRKIRTAPVTGGQAEIAVQKTGDGFAADVLYRDLGISLTMDVRLTEDAVRISVPEASIAESDGGGQLQALYLYPFFGGTQGVQAEKGYMLIPDGSGALIGLHERTTATQPYIGRVYGDDLGMKGGIQYASDSLANFPEQIYLPVFGMAHREGGNAYVSMITGGAPYAEIRSYPSGVISEYNWTAVRWIYREEYFQPLDKKGKGVQLNQKERNRFDASLTIMPLAGEQADYSGMASRVRRELVQRGELPEVRREAAGGHPLRIEFLAAERKTRMIGSEVIPMTTVEKMDGILEDLRNRGAERPMVVVRGYSKGGAGGASPTHFPFEGKVGSGGEWKTFIEKYDALDIPVYFHADYVLAAKGGGGYGKEDIAQSVSRQLLSYFDHSYFLQPEVSGNLFEREVASFRKLGPARLAMESVGSYLFSAHEKKESTRSQSIGTYQAMLSHDALEGAALYRPNLYLWKYADSIADIPMSSSGFLLETEDVPFLQLVLKGHIDYYAPASNFNANPRGDLLRMIDYGSYPSYILTDEDPIRLLETGSSWIYTSQYAVWKEQIASDYRTIADALLPVADSTFEKREEVEKGVFRNRYSNGTVIYINYTANEVAVDGRLIPAQGFLVREGGPS